MNVKTDLILEIATNLKEHTKGYTLKETKTHFGFLKTTVEILNKQGMDLFSQKKGHYITLDATNDYINNETIKKNIARELKDCIKEMIMLTKVNSLKKVLIVGLGNKQMVSDSLGTKVVEKLIITRHIKEVIKEDAENINSISAIAPGVLGTTGIETYHIVKGVVYEVKPDVVIIIDTLSTINAKKMASSFQLTNTGIVPGGGVGNARTPICKENLGVPVIVLGVPLVVYAYAMCQEVLETIVKEKNLENYEDDLKQIATSVLGDFIVTVKNIDEVVEECADIISFSLNLLINPQLVTNDNKTTIK